MIVFGGKDDDNEKLGDIWEFDFASKIWEHITVDPPAPIPRSGHSAIPYKNLMLVFGGIHEVTRELDDCWFYDPKNRQWITLFEEITKEQR